MSGSGAPPVPVAQPTGRVVVVGSLNIDHTVRVHRLPEPGATVAATRYERAAGGKGLNQVVAAARQGAPTAMVGAVGADAPGSELLEVLAREGIDRTGVKVTSLAPTGVALVTVSSSGENVIVVAAGANASVEVAQTEEIAWSAGDVALCQLEIPATVAQAALAAARAAGATTILNPAPAAGPLPGSLLAVADVLVPNEGEAAALSGLPAGSDPVGQARALAGGSGATVVITRGSRGSLLVPPSGPALQIAAHPVTVVDTTGAGDGFCGALAAALCRGQDLGAALQRASAAGSLATTRDGAAPSMPTASEVDRMLAR